MKGIRTYFRQWNEPGFRQSYRCLYPLIDGFHFYLLNGNCVFHFPWDDDRPVEAFINAAIDYDASGRLYSASSLIANDVYVTDDWNGIVLTSAGDISTNRSIAEVVGSLNPKPVTDEHRIIFFHNFDGAFWEFFSNDPSFASMMLRTHRGSPELDLRAVDYLRDYPDPGRYQSDYPPPA